MSMTATAQWAAFPSHTAEIARVREEFITAYGYEPDGVWSAPGRLNLLGEYIDFLGGSCLPMPLPYRTYIAGALRRDGVYVLPHCRCRGTSARLWCAISSRAI